MKSSSKLQLFVAITAIFNGSMACADDEINPLVVTGSRTQQRLTDVMPSVSVITQEDLERTRPVDVLQALQGEPGLEVLRNSNVPSIFLRGSSSAQFLLLIDGVKVGDDGTGVSGIENIPISQIDHIEIVRGNASAVYGSKAMGGVIQVFTKGGQGLTGPSGSLSYGTQNTFNASAGYGIAHEGTKISVNLNHQQSNGYQQINLSQYPGTNPSKNAYVTDSISAQASQVIVKGQEIGAKIFYAANKYQYTNPVAENPSWGYSPDPGLYKVQNSTQTLQGYSKNKITDIWLSNLTISSTKISSTTNYGGNPQYIIDNYNASASVPISSFSNPYMASNTNQMDYLWTNDFDLGGIGSVLAGAEVNTLTSNYLSVGDSSSGSRQITSFFGGYTGKFDELGVQANLRNDQMSVKTNAAGSSNSVNATTGLFGLSYQLNPQWKVAGVISSSFNAPTVFQLYSSQYGNPNLKPEQLQSYEGSLQYAYEDSLIRLAAYQNQYTDLITNSSAFPWPYINVNKATITGAELSANTRFMGNLIKLAFTLQNPINDQTQKQLMSRSKEFGSLEISRQIDKFNFGGQVLASGSRPSMAADYSTITLPGYAILNLFTSYKFEKNLSAQLRIENLFNTNYQTWYGYNNPGFGAYLTLSYSPK